MRYERLSRGGKEVTGREGSVVVALKLIDEPDFATAATWTSSTTSIDRSSGTIRGRAQFANPDGMFTPGMFARVPGAGLAAL